MLTQVPRDTRQILAGKANCISCHAPMVRLGPDYTCPTRVNAKPHSCPDNTINAERLLRLVATQVMQAVMTNEVVQKITGLIRTEADDTSERLQKHLDQIEHALSELNQRQVDLNIRRESIWEDAPISVDDLQEFVNKRAALSYEARNSRREIDAQAFVSDEDRIAANAADVATYLDQASPETTTLFMDTFVKSLGLGPGSIELTYRFPIPSEEHPEGRTRDVIQLPESDQTGVLQAGGPPDDPESPPSAS